LDAARSRVPGQVPSSRHEVASDAEALRSGRLPSVADAGAFGAVASRAALTRELSGADVSQAALTRELSGAVVSRASLNAGAFGAVVSQGSLTRELSERSFPRRR
jgi:hypothetical protein